MNVYGETTVALRIPEDWTPSQAAGVVELLDDLLSAIWKVHGDAIVPVLVRSAAAKPYEEVQDDDIPF